MSDTVGREDSGQVEGDAGGAVALEGGIGDLAERMGILLLEASAERTVATMPVAGNTQPYGLLHGGASVVLAETVGSIAAHLHAGPGRAAVGIEVNATHHRGVRRGLVTGVATAIHLGARAASYSIEVTDEVGLRVSTARLTCLVLDTVPSSSRGQSEQGSRRREPASR